MPPELTVVTNPDGTNSIVPNPAPGAPGSTLVQNGSMVLPDSDCLETKPDGSVCINGKTLPPGTQVQKLPDGSVVVSQPPPTVDTQSDGSVCVGTAKLPPDSQITSNGNIILADHANITFKNDGSVVINGEVLPAGTNVFKLEEGGHLVIPGCSNINGDILLSQSSIIVLNPDGSISVDGNKLSLPPGTQVKKLPDGGFIIINGVANANGTGNGFNANNSNNNLSADSTISNSECVVSLPKDTVITKNADGSFVVDGKLMPSGTQVAVNSDGSVLVTQPATATPKIETSQSGNVTIGGVQLPSGTKSTAEGKVLLPQGSKLTNNPDGTQLINGKMLPSGSRAQVNSDGTISILTNVNELNGENLTVRKQLDGSLCVGNTTLPKGSSQNIDGSISLPPTSKVVKNADGTVSVNGKKLPPGTELIKNPDGSMNMVINSGNSQESVKSNNDGSLSIGNVKLPKESRKNTDGSVTLPKSSNILKNKDGTISIDGTKIPPGFKLVQNQDGTFNLAPETISVSTQKDGSIQVGNMKLPLGSKANNDGSITLPSKASIKTNSDGTISFDGKAFPSGTRIVDNQDGTKSILLPNLLSHHSGFV